MIDCLLNLHGPLRDAEQVRMVHYRVPTGYYALIIALLITCSENIIARDKVICACVYSAQQSFEIDFFAFYCVAF